MPLSRTTRRLIVAGLIILFLVVAPMLILYAQGFRYDFAGKSIEQVGMIMVSYDPTEATATVDGEAASFDITALGYDRFSDLTPGEYYTEVSLAGYHTWSKTLEAVPEVVTWARYVTLFLDDPEPQDLVTMEQIWTQAISPDQRWLCIGGKIDGQTTIRLQPLIENDNLGTETFRLTELDPRLDPNAEVKEIIFAPDSNHIMLHLQEKDNNTYLSFSRELSSEEPTIILNDYIKNISEVRWHPENASIFYVLSENDLFRLAPSVRQTPRKLASQVLGFDPNISGLYFIRPRDVQIRDELQASLKKMELDGSSPETMTEDIELTDSYQIATSAEERIAIRTNTGRLYTYLPEAEKTERIAMDASAMEWSLDNDNEESTDELLMYANDYEIYTYDPTIENSEAITRYTEKINNAFWYTGNYKYIVFSVGNKIKIIELDETDRRNCADIWQAAEKEDIAADSGYIGQDNENLYFTINSEKKDSVKKFKIRE